VLVTCKRADVALDEPDADAADGLVNGRTGIVKHIQVSKHLGK
jgi:hypothetical protein